jgi:hypothetical protein
LVVRSTGVYGYVGQYTLSGTVPTGTTGGSGGSTENPGTNNPGNNNSGSGNQTPSAPEIAVLDGSTNLVDNTATVSYGTVQKGTTVSKTFTVRNDGTSNLVLTQLKEKNLPKGFKLVRGLSDTLLSAGESTTFIVSMKNSKGSYGGSIAIANNDADENPFNFRISGVVNKTGVVGGKSEFVAADESVSGEIATGVTLAETNFSIDNALFSFEESDDFHSLTHLDDHYDEIATQTVAQASIDLALDRFSGVRESAADIEHSIEGSLDELADLLSEALLIAA